MVRITRRPVHTHASPFPKKATSCYDGNGCAVRKCRLNIASDIPAAQTPAAYSLGADDEGKN